MSWQLQALKYLPKNLMSRTTGWLVSRRLPKGLAVRSMRWFAHRYQINLEEAEFSIEHYSHIGALFTRRLKPGLRPIQGIVVHPCDAVLTELGQIIEGRAVQVKGIDYAVSDLIEDAALARLLEGGHFLTYYLSPKDLHRVYSPCSGEITECVHLPGNLWPVNEESVQSIHQLFVVNERLVIQLKTAKGPVFVVMVGATNVGKMTASFDAEVVTNRLPSRVRRTYQPPLSIKTGEELGIFHMGSTVVLLTPPGFLNQLPNPGGVKVGQVLGGPE